LKLFFGKEDCNKIYFKEFAKFIPERYGFISRNQSFIRNSKNNATDVINALLNYGYSVLAGDIQRIPKFLEKVISKTDEFLSKYD